MPIGVDDACSDLSAAFQIMSQAAAWGDIQLACARGSSLPAARSVLHFVLRDRAMLHNSERTAVRDTAQVSGGFGNAYAR
ncbi:hypothetical protein WOLCODRAFT_156892 [Wolfiporia cocos MD-104 SS10]|uniref:Uncharacterized protein n=1 Tax=Wolfiporia cocos (strain MD-104) TaxID=742152 RepID=A0A2H3J383_WOLCO|nr:hypothetical protein WOLCODRAFT_156892 [Wolfiporia cocos MD-104 SS10]